MKRKRIIIAGLLAVMMAVAWMVPTAADAAQKTAGKQMDNAQLYSEYIQQTLDAALEAAEDDQSPAPKIKSLTGVNKAIYDQLKVEIAEVANGERASTVFTIPLEVINPENKRWTASDLGVEAITDEGYLRDDAMQALYDTIGYNLALLDNALQATLPYDLYWYDKINGIADSGFEIGVETDGEEEYLTIASGFQLSFSVAKEFAAGTEPYTVDTSCGSRVQEAVANAQTIVADNSQETDVQRLVIYREEICRKTSYNFTAADDLETPYGDPWQIIAVFDNDPTTNVVCEGYAKAFQYLCDLTQFSSSKISSRIVTGLMSGGTGSGDHMWNVVTMDDGRNYLVDVTNCDENSIGEPGLLFLAGSSEGSLEGGYTFSCNGGTVSYSYDELTLYLYDPEDLELAASNYQVNDTGEEYKEGGLVYSITSGSATVMGYTGNPTDLVIPEEVKGVPVKFIDEKAFRYCESLKSVTFPSSIRKIGFDVAVDGGESGFDGSFTGCENLTTVQFQEPSDLQLIGFGAFMDCGKLTSISIPEGTEKIAQNALTGTGIRKLELPASLREYNPVNTMDQLEEISIKENTSIYRSEDGILYEESPEYGMVLVCFPAAKSMEQYTPPSWVDWVEGAFFYGEVKKIVLSGKTQISGGGLINCDSFEVSGSDHYAVEDGMLYSNNFDTLYAIPQSKTGTVKINEKVRKIESWAGYGGKFTSVIIPDGVTELTDYCFRESSLQTVEMPDSVEVIAGYTFYGCKDLKITAFPKNLKSLSWNALAEVDVSEAQLPEGFEDLGYQAFAFSIGAGELVLPSTVKTMDTMCLCESHTVLFTGDMPEMAEVLSWWPVRLFYPADNPTWNAAALKERAKIEDIHEEWIPYTGDPQLVEGVHSWGEPEYQWADDNSEVMAICVCEGNSSHKIEETVKTTAEVTKPATFTEKGETTYTAVFTNPAFSTQEKTVENIDKLSKLENPMTVEVLPKTVKAKKLKKKAITIAPLTISNNKGPLTCTKVSGKKKFKVLSDGRIKVAKKTKKGIYQIGVEVTAGGNRQYQAKSVTEIVTITIK